MSLSPRELEQFVAELVADRDRWSHLVRHADDVRVYELIWDDEDVNAWVICWSEDQDTGFHDHDESGARIAVISGQIREERLRLGASPQSAVYGPGAEITIPPTAIHRVLHAGDGPAVTIHAYSPPLTRTGAYRVAAGGALERESQSFEDELRAEEALAAEASLAAY
jgi:predicted metal-dependent enzyme (double-stranded beta helix superfamily)